MNICRALGHRFQAHPAGYHFCRRCGASQMLHEAFVAKLLSTSWAPDKLNDYTLRAAEGETGASPPARSPTESPGGGGDSAFDTKAAPEQPTPAPARDKHAEPAGGGEAASTDDPIFLAAERNAATGSPPTECEETPDADRVRARLEKYLQIRELTITSATKEGLDLGASVAVLYNLKGGKHVSDATLQNVDAALDRLFIEDETPDGEVGPKIQVEKLPSTLPPITGTNTIPKPTVPARCARTP